MKLTIFEMQKSHKLLKVIDLFQSIILIAACFDDLGSLRSKEFDNAILVKFQIQSNNIKLGFGVAHFNDAFSFFIANHADILPDDVSVHRNVLGSTYLDWIVARHHLLKLYIWLYELAYHFLFLNFLFWHVDLRQKHLLGQYFVIRWRQLLLHSQVVYVNRFIYLPISHRLSKLKRSQMVLAIVMRLIELICFVFRNQIIRIVHWGLLVIQGILHKFLALLWLSQSVGSTAILRHGVLASHFLQPLQKVMVLLLDCFQLPPSLRHSVVRHLIANEIHIGWASVILSSNIIGLRGLCYSSHIVKENSVLPLNLLITFISHLYTLSIIDQPIFTITILIIHSLTQFWVTLHSCII